MWSVTWSRSITSSEDDDKYAFFRDDQETDAITEHKLGIASVEHELDAHRAVAAERSGERKWTTSQLLV
jgi:DNA mismatch repair protein MSH3